MSDDTRPDASSAQPGRIRRHAPRDGSASIAGVGPGTGSVQVIAVSSWRQAELQHCPRRRVLVIAAVPALQAGEQLRPLISGAHHPAVVRDGHLVRQDQCRAGDTRGGGALVLLGEVSREHDFPGVPLSFGPERPPDDRPVAVQLERRDPGARGGARTRVDASAQHARRAGGSQQRLVLLGAAQRPARQLYPLPGEDSEALLRGADRGLGSRVKRRETWGLAGVGHSGPPGSLMTANPSACTSSTFTAGAWTPVHAAMFSCASRSWLGVQPSGTRTTSTSPGLTIVTYSRTRSVSWSGFREDGRALRRPATRSISAPGSGIRRAPAGIMRPHSRARLAASGSAGSASGASRLLPS